MDRARRRHVGSVGSRAVRLRVSERTHSHGGCARLRSRRPEEAGKLDEDGSGRAVRLGGRLVASRRTERRPSRTSMDRARPHPALLPPERPGRGCATGSSSTCWTRATGSAWRGALFRTRMGEVTVRVARFELLAKSLRPLPSRQGGGRPGDRREAGLQRLRGHRAAIPSALRRLAVHPEVREVFVARARVVDRDASVPRRPRLTLRWRRRYSSRSTAGPRPARS